MHVGSSSPTRDRTQAPCIGSVESSALCHQGSPTLHDSCLNQSLLRWLQNDDLLAVTIPPCTPVGLAFSCKLGPSLLPMYLFIYLFIIDSKIWPDLASRSPFLVLCDTYPSFCWYFITFWHYKNVPGSSCTYPASVLESSISPRTSGFFQ